MDNFLAILQAEYLAWEAAVDKRAYLAARVGTLYDAYILPVDLPGPDAIVDPIAKAALVNGATAVYDAIAAKLAAGEAVGWPAPVTEA